jgi:hypothetical protein
VVGRLRRRTGESGFPDRGAGLLDRRAGHDRRVRPVDGFGRTGRLPEQHLCRDGDDVPAQGRRYFALRTRGVAQVPLLRGPDRDLRLLVRVVERARDQRLRDRHPRAGAVVRGHDVHPGRRQLPVEPAGLDRDRLHHRRLALQHLRRPAGGLARLPHRRPADPPGGRADVPALHHGRLVERQHDLGHRRQRRLRARDHVALLHGVVGLRCCPSGSAARSARRPSPKTRQESPSTPRASKRSSGTRSPTRSSCASSRASCCR